MQILLSGPDFHDYNEFVANGFEELGHDVDISHWPELWGRISRRARLYIAKRHLPEYEFQKYVLETIDDVIQQYNKQLLDQIRAESPDMFLTLNGKILLPETIEKASEHTTTVMWCYDKATAFPAVVEGAAHYDLFYVFESSDVPELGEHGVNVTFLPMGYDPTYYNELDEDETIDVSFVGSLNDRRKRLVLHSWAGIVYILFKLYRFHSCRQYQIYLAFPSCEAVSSSRSTDSWCRSDIRIVYKRHRLQYAVVFISHLTLYHSRSDVTEFCRQRRLSRYHICHRTSLHRLGT